MKTEAAVVWEPKGPFQIEAVELEEPRATEVLVRTDAVGICHTDLLARDGLYPTPMPMVAGHEGTGVVEAVGASVTKVRVGDRVLLSYECCGHCRNCRAGDEPYCDDMFSLNFAGSRGDGSTPISRDGAAIHANFMGQSSFARHAIADQRTVALVPGDLPAELVAPLACGVQTGAGTVANVLRPEAGAAIAVFGAGAVGLSAVMMAAICGCAPIVVVDKVPGRLRLAGELGATNVVDASAEDPVAAIQRLTGGGAQYSVEAAGTPRILAWALECLRETGVCALVGAAAHGTEGAFDWTTLLRGRTIRGTIMGDSIPDNFVPRLVRMVESGRLPVERLVETYRFEQINDAAAESERGSVVKPVLLLDR